MTGAPVWTEAQLENARQLSEAGFREERLAAPLELYLDVFDQCQGEIETFIEETVDLLQLREVGAELLQNATKLELLRYLTGPPVSLDDLKILIKGRSLSQKRFREDPELVARLIEFVLSYHDRRRFPWLSEGWQPEDQEDPRRDAAVLATTALLAASRTATKRRGALKELQEKIIADKLEEMGFQQVPTRRVTNQRQAPQAGEFCRESRMGAGKADFIVGLWDGRLMPLECKVSNSETNSYKRLNRECAAKAEAWLTDFGVLSTVPVAVLAGCYSMNSLKEAQQRGLRLFWSHDLEPMFNWIEGTRTTSR